jgi:hypothetical protein
MADVAAHPGLRRRPTREPPRLSMTPTTNPDRLAARLIDELKDCTRGGPPFDVLFAGPAGSVPEAAVLQRSPTAPLLTRRFAAPATVGPRQGDTRW